ncbi:unnamed protein product [Urochloa decumbens]|uniref:Uncharacterized protein n=1 Tax=Urochloa decumbens TaxID=240449 RepID=A0ABC8Y778_9POAL
MGRFENAAALVAVSLLLLLACDAAVLGDHPSSSPVMKQQRQPAAHVGEILDDQDCAGDVDIFQGDEGPQPGQQPGFRTFEVEITNMSIHGRNLHDVRVSCAGFDDSSFRHIPIGFTRISESECLVKDGGEFPPFDTVEFEYESESQYPFVVSSASC